MGDNSDWAPNDSTESADSDGDGVGNNADAFPTDASETKDSDGDGVGDNEQLAAEEKAQRNLIIIIVGLVLIIAGGTVFFLRKKSSSGTVKDFSASEELSNIQMASIPTMNQQFNPATAQQPVVSQSQATVINQWTDESGYTWRSLSDGTMEWWTGSDWKKR